MMTKRRYWTEGEEVSMRELYPYLPTFRVAWSLRRSIQQVYNKALAMGLKKHPSYFEKFPGGRIKGMSCSKGSEFKKGHQPWNKGLKGFKPGGRSVETQFKPGQLPAQTLYDGAITIRYDNRGVPVKHIRTAQAKWEYLSRHTWRQHHGEIPPGHNIIHLDGDSMNCDIENLACISRRENMRRNSIVNYPPELRAAIHSLSKLKRTIHEKQDH